LFRNAKAGQFVSHYKVFAVKESEECGGLGDIDGIHIVVIEAEYF